MERPKFVDKMMRGVPMFYGPAVLDEIRAYIESLERDAARLRAAQAIAAEQAEDEALWCIATSIVEAYFQQELRRLTAAVEGDAALSQQKGGA